MALALLQGGSPNSVFMYIPLLILSSFRFTVYEIWKSEPIFLLRRVDSTNSKIRFQLSSIHDNYHILSSLYAIDRLNVSAILLPNDAQHHSGLHQKIPGSASALQIILLEPDESCSEECGNGHGFLSKANGKLVSDRSSREYNNLDLLSCKTNTAFMLSLVPVMT